ncbi:MAG: hypothetical protein ACTS3F_07205 [Phycisphaerales bacterium]
MKKFLLWSAAAALLLIAALAVLLLTAPKAPQRDYIAEFDAMISERFPDASGGIAEFEALVALDRYQKVRDIARAETSDALEWGWDQGYPMSRFYQRDIAIAVMYPDNASRRIDVDSLSEDERAAMELVLARVRERAWPQIRAVLEDPEALRLMRAFNEHEVVVMPQQHATSLIDRPMPPILQARDNAKADELLYNTNTDPRVRREAIASILGNARLAGATPTHLSGLVAVAAEVTAAELVLGGATTGEVRADQARALIEEFRMHRGLRPEGAWYFQGEALVKLDLIDAHYTNRPGASRLDSIGTAPIVGMSHGGLYKIIDDYYARLIREFGKPAALRDMASLDPDAYMRTIDIRARRQFEILRPVFGAFFMNFDTAEAGLAAATTALAIAAYMDEHDGTPPPTLESLVPGYLPELPADPFAATPGAPLVYRVDAEGEILLYSLGINATDDGGAPPSDPEQDRRKHEDLIYWPWER